jgi:hypothetical protein
MIIHKRPKGEYNRLIDCLDISRLFSRVFIGSYEGAGSYEALKLNGITHILTTGNDMEEKYISEFKYCVINVDDDPDEKINKWFQKCIQFLDELLNENKNNIVLIHCYAGISRSATITIAYIIHHKKIRLIEAFEELRLARWFINPNKGFMKQLQQFSKESTGDDGKYNDEYFKAKSLIYNGYFYGSMDVSTIKTIYFIFIKVFGKYHPHTLSICNELEALLYV